MRKVLNTLVMYGEAFGAASASNGSVGLYHVENLTPEAVELGESLIKENAKTFVIDDAEIARVKASYPVTWKDEEGAPEIAFAGCPHFSCDQLLDWTGRLEEGLKRHGREKVTVPTIFCAAPDVRAHFENEYPEEAGKLKKMGVTVSGLCPLSYTSNPKTENSRIITASNKLRYYSKARFFDEAELVEIITGGRQ